MTQLLISVPSVNVGAVVDAIRAIEPAAKIGHLIDLPPPPPQPVPTAYAPSLVEAIAEAIRPTAKTPSRREALDFALRYGDTFSHSHGAADHNLRAALGALSKSLRKVFPHDASPIDRLAVREKQFFNEGPYRGTVYKRTPLGTLVLNLLQSKGLV